MFVIKTKKYCLLPFFKELKNLRYSTQKKIQKSGQKLKLTLILTRKNNYHRSLQQTFTILRI